MGRDCPTVSVAGYTQCLAATSVWQQYTGVPSPPWAWWRQPLSAATDGTDSKTLPTSVVPARRSTPLWSSTAPTGAEAPSRRSSSATGMEEKIMLSPPSKGYLMYPSVQLVGLLPRATMASWGRASTSATLTWRWIDSAVATASAKGNAGSNRASTSATSDPLINARRSKNSSVSTNESRSTPLSTFMAYLPRTGAPCASSIQIGYATVHPSAGRRRVTTLGGPELGFEPTTSRRQPGT